MMIKKHILIVDDDDQFRTLLRQILERRRQGDAIYEAVNGQDAMYYLNNFPIELVLLDIIMPEKEGIETLIEIRNNYPGVKVISMSGGSPHILADLNLTLCKRLGANDIIAKPFEFGDLYEKIESLLLPETRIASS